MRYLICLIFLLASVSPSLGRPQTPTTRAEQRYAQATQKAEKKDLEGAIIDLNEAIRLDPYMDKAYTLRGRVYEELNNFERADADNQKARSIRAYKKGVELIQKDDLPGAISSFTDAITRDPKAYEAFYQRGLLYGADGDYGRAVSDLSNAIKSKPDYVDAYYFRGLYHLENGSPDNAVQDFNRVIALNAVYFDAYTSLGDAYMKLRQFDKAEAIYRRALASKSDDADVLNGLGAALLEQSVTDEALEHLKKADRLRPGDPQIMSNLGFAYFREGNDEKAKDLLVAARNKDKENVEIKERLGEVYARLGDFYKERNQPALAQDNWKKASDLLSNEEQKQSLRVKINNLSKQGNDVGRAPAAREQQQADLNTPDSRVDSTPASRQDSEGGNKSNNVRSGQGVPESRQGNVGGPAGNRRPDEALTQPVNASREPNSRPANDAFAQRNQGEDRARLNGGPTPVRDEKSASSGQPAQPPAVNVQKPATETKANALPNLTSAGLNSSLKKELADSNAAFMDGIKRQRNGEWEAAEKSFNKALLALPKSESNLYRASILSELGHALFQRNKLDDAYSRLTEAASLSPDDGKILDRLGDVLNKLGQKAESKSERAKALSYFNNALTNWSMAIHNISDPNHNNQVRNKIKDVDNKLKSLSKQ